MARFQIGDHLAHLNGSHDGKLIDIDGSTAYLMQANGVEIEFPLDQLKPFDAAAPKQPRPGAPAQPYEKRLSPAHQALLASVPATVLAAIARNYDRADPPAPFASLSDVKKLGVIRVYLPQVEHSLLVNNMKLVVAMRDLGKADR